MLLLIDRATELCERLSTLASHLSGLAQRVNRLLDLELKAMEEKDGK